MVILISVQNFDLVSTLYSVYPKQSGILLLNEYSRWRRCHVEFHWQHVMRISNNVCTDVLRLQIKWSVMMSYMYKSNFVKYL